MPFPRRLGKVRKGKPPERRDVRRPEAEAGLSSVAESEGGIKPEQIPTQSGRSEG